MDSDNLDAVDRNGSDLDGEASAAEPSGEPGHADPTVEPVLDLDAAEAPEMDDDELGAVLEALLLVVDTPASVEQLATATEQPAYRVAAKLQLMAQEYTERDSGIDLREAGGGWRMYTRAKYAPYVERLLLDGARSKLTRAALETLAVIAYRQPVTRARVSAVRGVNVDAVIRTLVARGLITEAGTDPDTGATTFATTELFLERLGLSSLADLPDIAPLLPDVDVIDDLSESLDEEPRFAKLSGGGNSSGGGSDQPIDVDTDADD
ncbi:SMC-Scp complex subunit ScpB [Mycolicibacterium phlei]